MRLFFYVFLSMLFLGCIAGCSRKQILEKIQHVLHLHPANIHDESPADNQTEEEIIEDIIEDSFDIAEDVIEDIVEGTL